MILKHGNGKITFIFDQASDSPVFLTGDFNNWSTQIDAMEFIEEKWQKTIKLKPGAYQFKYFTIEKDSELQWFNDWRADAYVKSPYGGENSVVIID